MQAVPRDSNLEYALACNAVFVVGFHALMKCLGVCYHAAAVIGTHQVTCI